MAPSLPQLVIIGRPNVGKSSLLNMLAKRRVSIVDPTAGVTRDRVAARAEMPDGRCVELVDTGGYGIEDPQQLTTEIEWQIVRGLEQADAVLFVIDAQVGVTPLDRTVADVLRKSTGNKPVILVANKVDGPHWEADGYDATRLGFGDPVLLSATSGHNKQALYEAIGTHVVSGPPHDLPPDPGTLLAIVGKRNAGKSTLVNALAGDERVIVSDQEGTTRDAVDVRFEVNGQVFTAIDTAGLRRRKSLAGDIEFYSHHRALRSVRRADVCLFLIDASCALSQVDRQLAHEILKHHRATVLVVNKWDLAQTRHTQEQYADYLDNTLRGLSYAPIVFVSAKNHEGLHDALAMALNLCKQTHHRVDTAELNQVIERISQLRGPSPKGGRQAKIYYAAQVAVNPPTLVLKVNQPDLFDHNYQLFLLNRLRDEVPYSEVPIKLVIRGKE